MSKSSAVENIRSSVVAIFRLLPSFPGRGRIATALNSVFLNFGASPIVVAKMAGGYQLRLDCRLFTHCHAYYFGEYDDAKRETLLRFISIGGVALDVGANIGLYTVPMALKAQQLSAHIFASEPLASNAAWLRENLILNRVDLVTTVMPFGLSDAPGKTEIVLAEDFLTGAHIGNATIATEMYDSRFRREQISLETLDRIWPAIGLRLDIIKLDIEGHEAKFLCGAADTIALYRPVILMEVNRWFYNQRNENFDQLIADQLPANYRIAQLNSSTKLCEIGHLSECKDTDIFLIPAERMP